ncbi:hypothetical protein ES332_A02G194100v1 [Gossypium tomentosum]|uniref:Uncharacterized protein n=1 Tax=Gossypium tomentosum TaxID=34277 RepID=A0A5D2RMX8_GOSTO|nr:hypothetical protein ES332_A02G194100v1 [Gossypium tomentosum]
MKIQRVSFFLFFFLAAVFAVLFLSFVCLLLQVRRRTWSTYRGYALAYGGSWRSGAAGGSAAAAQGEP